MPCHLNHWGEGCEQQCRCNNSPCDPITGECQCKPGTAGDRCELDTNPEDYEVFINELHYNNEGD